MNQSLPENGGALQQPLPEIACGRSGLPLLAAIRGLRVFP
jgi:hypothetical protein